MECLSPLAQEPPAQPQVRLVIFLVRQVGYDHCCVIIWRFIISMSEILLKEYVMNAEAEVDLSITTCVYISRCRTYIY